jgi:hypothetical protein
MSIGSSLLRNVSLIDEMEFCDLGDARRTQRLQMVVDALSQDSVHNFSHFFKLAVFNLMIYSSSFSFKIHFPQPVHIQVLFGSPFGPCDMPQTRSCQHQS